jgi:hypothetical protein
MTTISILSSAIQPVDGIQKRSTISVEQAKELLIQADTVVSYVGHPGTAAYLSQVLDLSVETTRGQYKPQTGDRAIAVTAKERLPEGQILSAEEMIGKFDLILLEQLPE